MLCLSDGDVRNGEDARGGTRVQLYSCVSIPDDSKARGAGAKEMSIYGCGEEV